MKNQAKLETVLEADGVFPSPCGEMVMKNHIKLSNFPLFWLQRFRPLAGKWL